MSRLSSPLEDIKSHYTVVVVGSGYGGAIVASRLARAGQQVCVLERGREFQPGEYPDTEVEALSEMQADLPSRHTGSHSALYDFRVNEDISVFVGCGLGGTSLVNANVSLRADPRVFDDPCWPSELRLQGATELEEFYRRAEEMLQPRRYPDSFPRLAKMEALKKSARFLNHKFELTPINVTFEDGINAAGVEQKACTLCGDCVSGCNHQAKNTVLMNYLPDAKNHGAEIFTLIQVRRLEQKDGQWLVYYNPLETGRETFEAPEMFITADIVVLAAGTLGSTEILLRSRAAGLPVSDRLGERFTGNGDVLAFAYNNDVEINGIGVGSRDPAEHGNVGPCISGVIDARDASDLNEGMVIEEGSIPGAFASLAPKTFAAAAALVGKDMDSGVADLIEERKRELASLVCGPYQGAIRNTQTFLVMTHDDAGGKLYLDDDRLRISWPGVGAQPIFSRIQEKLRGATQANGGTFIKNPMSTRLAGNDLITVHPLGGCAMAESAAEGVVNHKGQVFSGTAGTAVYAGVYVCDGAIVPRPLGVNPLLTISALAERCAELLAQDRGWAIDLSFKPIPKVLEKPIPLGIQFTETMRGYFSREETRDYRLAADRGRKDDSSFQFILTIVARDLEQMLSDPKHPARLAGNVIAPALSTKPLVAKGDFNLFVDDPDRVATREMHYRMTMTSVEGGTFYFSGFKVIHDDRGLDIWSDTTTLHITVFEGDSDQGPLLGKGILRIRPVDFVRQLTTMQVTNAPSLKESLAAQSRFGQLFAGALFESYGGVLSRRNVFDPEAAPRKKRPLRTSPPKIYFFNTSDDVRLRLTRYQGGKKGPVILSPGLGVSSLIFSIDTIETNLVEFLFAHGYDVWLLDHRASIDLEASATEFSGDEIATRDYPAAVAKVCELAQTDSVQVVAHCFGATTFLMAMLAGLEGVRSAVCSQIATHVIPPAATRIKCGIYLPSFLDAIGVESLTAYVDTHANWMTRLYDKALALYPTQKEERCDSLVCPRIAFMYGPLFEHDQLNVATHNALHEMFGMTGMKVFEHIALLVRKGHLVNAAGEERYLPHLKRLSIPITFIHGAENACFLPESTKIAYNLLRNFNGKNLYDRRVIPNYGHIDCIFGKNAASDVYPIILDHLEGLGT